MDFCIFKNCVQWECMSWGVYLVKGIHLRAPYMICIGYLVAFGGHCWYHFSFNFQKCFLEWEFVTLGILFSEAYSFVWTYMNLYELCVFCSFWKSFCGKFWAFKSSSNVFGIRMYDFEGGYLIKFIHLRAPYMIFGSLVVFVDYFCGYFLCFWSFQKWFWNENMWHWRGPFQGNLF